MQVDNREYLNRGLQVGQLNTAYTIEETEEDKEEVEGRTTKYTGGKVDARQSLHAEAFVL